MKRRRNPYNYLDVMNRDNCSESEAKRNVQELKNRTSGSLKTFISRYGATEGTKRYRTFCEKSANNKEKFQEKYGDNWEPMWDNYLKSKDSMSKEFHIEKYGEIVGLRKFNERRKSVSSSLARQIERYGELEGNLKYEEANAKRAYSGSTEGLIKTHGTKRALEINKSKALIGSKNGMYGRPSPVGSGNGWSGWYLDIYFRSLLELAYLKYLLDNNIGFENGECAKYKIKYNIDGVERTYSCDYVLITGEYIEVKPKNLVNSKENSYKFEAARNKVGNAFKIITEDNINKLTDKEIYELVLSEDIVFIERYKQKFNEKWGIYEN